MSAEICTVTCIVCPAGCRIRVLKEGARITEVTGNTCRRGEAYASQEAVAPQRTLTTSVKAVDGDFPLVSVRSLGPVPKGRLFDLMGAVRSMTVTAPIHVGDAVARNVLGLGIDLVATRAVGRLPRRTSQS
jgi:CxxC motif-containing protein